MFRILCVGKCSLDGCCFSLQHLLLSHPHSPLPHHSLSLSLTQQFFFLCPYVVNLLPHMLCAAIKLASTFSQPSFIPPPPPFAFFSSLDPLLTAHYASACTPPPPPLVIFTTLLILSPSSKLQFKLTVSSLPHLS